MTGSRLVGRDLGVQLRLEGRHARQLGRLGRRLGLLAQLQGRRRAEGCRDLGMGWRGVTVQAGAGHAAGAAAAGRAGGGRQPAPRARSLGCAAPNAAAQRHLHHSPPQRAKQRSSASSEPPANPPAAPPSSEPARRAWPAPPPAARPPSPPPAPPRRRGSARRWRRPPPCAWPPPQPVPPASPCEEGEEPQGGAGSRQWVAGAHGTCLPAASSAELGQLSPARLGSGQRAAELTGTGAR